MALLEKPTLGFSHLLNDDLDQILLQNSQHLEYFQGKRVLILGGTGFVGKWLVGTLLQGQRELNLNTEIVVLTRSADLATKVIKPNGNSRITFLEHNLANSAPTNIGSFDIFIHGATSSVPGTGSKDLAAVRSSSINATQTILNSINNYGGQSRVLNLSSGAVYGKQRTSEGKVPEMAEFGATENSYAKVKIEIEQQLNALQLVHVSQLTHARLFAFAGPFISLTDHFAIGNFIYNILSRSPIVVSGSPETTRSYMHPTDLIASLLRVIGKPEISYLNIGSADGFTMKEIAEVCSKLGGNLPIEFRGEAQISSHYVPVVERQTKILQFSPFYDFQTSIIKWIRWLDESGYR